jgi:hypothetical protein
MTAPTSVVVWKLLPAVKTKQGFQAKAVRQAFPAISEQAVFLLLALT